MVPDVADAVDRSSAVTDQSWNLTPCSDAQKLRRA